MTNHTERFHQATRDQIMTSPRRDGYSVEVQGESGRFYLEALSVERDMLGEVGGYAQSYHTGQLYRWRQTGWAVRSNQVTVRVAPAEDTGDLEGTLRFDFGSALPGRVNVNLIREV